MILVEGKETIAGWVLDKLDDFGRFDEAFLGNYAAMGFLNPHSKAKGGVIYYNYLGHSVEAVAAGEGYWLTPLNVRAIFIYPFLELRCRRMTVFAAKKNMKSRKFISKLGFRLEGKVRQGMVDGQDAIMYGMLKEECRWIQDGNLRTRQITDSGAQRRPIDISADEGERAISAS